MKCSRRAHVAVACGGSRLDDTRKLENRRRCTQVAPFFAAPLKYLSSLICVARPREKCGFGWFLGTARNEISLVNAFRHPEFAGRNIPLCGGDRSATVGCTTRNGWFPVVAERPPETGFW